jgi:tRNA threonylcarbamoyladenosine biosynthesis protein TsaE
VPESLTLQSAEETEAAGAALAKAVQQLTPATVCICLEGDLGAGKTTFARGFLRGFGHAGRVPSPTYTLVEPYECGAYTIYHLDLYRVQDGAELEFLGLAEMTVEGSVLLIEWPSRAGGSLPDKDIEVLLEVIPEGRAVSAQSYSDSGSNLVQSGLNLAN